MKTWLELWQLRERRSAELLLLDRVLANFVPDTDRRVIQDLTDPRGKRFLFDDFEGVAQQTISPDNPPSRPSLRPSWGNVLSFDRVRLRVCAPACTCPCVRCARARRPRWHACAPLHAELRT